MNAKVLEKSWEERAREIGAGATASIVAMVAALDCDYDRLEELREERAAYQEEDSHKPLTKSWAQANPDDAEELAELEEAAGDCESLDDAERRIQEDPLSLQFRSGWTSSGEPMQAEEFELLLATGGPAVRIVGELDHNGEPYMALLEVQDWFEPWTQYLDIDGDTLLEYCRAAGVYYQGG